MAGSKSECHDFQLFLFEVNVPFVPHRPLKTASTTMEPAFTDSVETTTGMKPDLDVTN